MSERRAHYVRPTTQNRQPRRHIFFDTEAQVTYEPDAGIQTQTWLCGVASFVDSERGDGIRAEHEYAAAGDLWQAVSRFARRDGRTVLWAHNVAYDLRIANALKYLPELGWSLQAIVLDGRSCWARFSQGKASLVCADLTSWLAVPLARVGAMVGVDQEQRPADPTDLRAQFKRCAQDVRILETVVMSILEWLEANDLGNFQLTGAAQAWSTFRHRFMTHRLLVHTDRLALDMERRAIWAGRTECWRHGTYDGPTFEFDMSRAYATIARDCTLPAHRLGTIPRMSEENLNDWITDRCLLSKCIVTTDVPVVPTEHDGRILWPTGRFRTVLWDHEIQAARARGARVQCFTTQVYTREPMLKAWGTWVLDGCDDERSPWAPLQQALLKHWSRALIGRFALRYREWSPMGTSDTPDLYLSELAGRGEGAEARMLQVGYELLELGELSESENSMPSVTGYVTSLCRVRLLALMERAGLDDVYYVDTDSIITNAAGAVRLRHAIAEDGAYGLVEKRAIHRLELNGPRQLAVNGNPRTAGIPRSAKRVTHDTYHGETWQGLGEALATGQTGRVLVYEREFHVRGYDRRRRWLKDGRTEPYRLTGKLDALTVA